jgi:hypothetical protein
VSAFPRPHVEPGAGCGLLLVRTVRTTLPLPWRWADGCVSCHIMSCVRLSPGHMRMSAARVRVALAPRPNWYALFSFCDVYVS